MVEALLGCGASLLLTSEWLVSGMVVLAVLSTWKFLAFEPNIQLAAAVAVLANRLGSVSSCKRDVHACQSTAWSESPSGD